MAAGDIILSNGTTITAAEIQQIAAEVKKELAAESKELSQFEEVTSLTNVSSLPGIQQSGATMKLVRVALSILKGLDGKNVELSASSTAIQWRYVGESTWKTLVELSLLKGDKGDKGEKGDTGATGATGPQGETKMPILSAVEATSGSTPSGSFTADGEDTSGNPKYKLSLVLPKGDKGEAPIIEEGTTTTGLPDTEASVEVVPNGQTEQGNPKYLLNFTIPKGDPGKDGEGAGNVYVAETGLVSGKKYLFQPGANNSPNGVFVEYVEPTIPEQVQPDWNATEGKGAILNKPAILPDAPKDGKQYARKDGAWEEVEAGDELSKDAIEQALTGNITTHRHDTTYNYTDFETDVWDGTSVSSSLQGSGTKDDPYLIQSCADWLHLRANGASQYNIYQGNELGEATEFKPVFKLTKNLDFNNKEIPQADTQEGITACEFDGNGAKFSNFKDNQKIGILPNCNYAFAHDFVIEGFNAVYASSTENIPIFSRNDMYTTLLNNVVKGYTNINGSIDEDKVYIAFLQGLGYMAMSSTAILNTLTSYIEEHGNYLGIDLELNNNVIKNNGAKLTYALGCYLNINPVNIYCATELSDFELSDTGEAIFTEDSNCVFNMITSVQPSNFYTNSDGSNKIAIQSMEGETTTFTGTPKSLTEMKSASFVEELNSHLPKPAFRQDPDGGTPILAGGNATIAYDGYVKKSEFEAFKAKLSVDTPSEGSPFVDIEMASTNFPTDNDTVELTPEQYSIIDGGLKEGKMLRIKAKCGIFFGSTTTLIPFDASGDITPDKMEPSVLIWSTSSSVGIGSAHVKAVQMSVYISHTPNEAGNYVATFYKMKGDFVLSEEITTIKKLTQSEYDEISSKNSKTLYVIVG